MSRLSRFLVFTAVLLFSFPVAAEAPRVGIEANGSFWILYNEEVQNQVMQGGSQDEAADTASGFNFKQGRFGFRLASPDERWEALVKLRLEERTDVLDFWGSYRPASWFHAFIGQMKIPLTHEVLQPDYLTDFITRTTYGQNVGNFSLARTPYISSLMNTTSYNRDLGLAFKGTIGVYEEAHVNYFLMVSNGAGAGNYIGGKESSEFFYTNRFGDFFYGGRIELSPWNGIVLGGHTSYNIHDNAILQDKKTAVDLERMGWSVDLQIKTPWGTKLYGFYGRGWMHDYFNSTHYAFDYNGWAVSVIQGLFDDKVEIGVRYDSFVTEFMNDGNETKQNNFTVGANWRPVPWTRLQLNYMWKDTVNDFEDDLADDIVFMNIQFMYEAWLSAGPE